MPPRALAAIHEKPFRDYYTAIAKARTALGAQGSWTKIATASAGYKTLNNLVIDRIAPAVVYFSDGGAVKRIANAATSTGVTNSQISTILTGGSSASRPPLREIRRTRWPSWWPRCSTSRESASLTRRPL